jgi:hypothetical protein
VATLEFADPLGAYIDANCQRLVAVSGDPVVAALEEAGRGIFLISIAVAGIKLRPAGDLVSVTETFIGTVATLIAV